MNILAIDSTTRVTTLALLSSSSLVEVEPSFGNAQSDAPVLAAMADLISQCGVSISQIDAVAFGCGPGAFTSLRSACSIALGLGLALDRPVVPVSSLRALVEPYPKHSPVLAALDARLGQVYWAWVSGDGCVQDGEPRCSDPDSVRVHLKPNVRVVGNAFGVYAEALLASSQGVQVLDSMAVPRAGAVARLAATALHAGEVFSIDDLAPVYVRNKIALTSIEQRAIQK